MINPFILNIFLAMGFSAVLGQFTLSGFIAGFIVGYLALWLTKSLYGDVHYFLVLPKALVLICFFIKELFVSNIRVLWEIIRPTPTSRPGIVGVPLDAQSDLEIMLVANLISLTPGTLSVDLSEDRRTLYVHVMFLDDPDRFRQSIKAGLEQRVLEVTRDH